MSDAQPVYRDTDDASLRPRTERPLGFRVRDDGTVGCPVCGDTGWVEAVNHAGEPDGVRPCERCKPETHKRWSNGTYKDRG